MNKKALLPLIGLFLLVTGIVLPGSAYAQISEGGTPTSFKYQNTLKSDLPTVQIPINFSVEDLKTVDRWQVSQGAPLKVGVLLPTDLTIDNAGSWNTLPDGKRVWRLQVQAKDAIALMLSFRDFYIPEKAMPTDLTSVYQNGEVLLKWKAPVSASEKPEQYNVYRNNILIGRTFSTSYIDKEPETGIQSYSVSASYTDNKESAVATTSIYVYELKIPTDVTTSTDGKNILVKWKEPIYQQMIYWGNGTAYLSLGFKQPFYFGQRWNKEDLKPLHGHLVESVSFIPTSGSSYTLNIIQGKRKYVQKLTNLPFDKLIEIPLKEPFVIDASQELIIAFHAEAKLSTAYPAVMDGGPAVNGKGNLISFDGETWEYLYEPSENENEKTCS